MKCLNRETCPDYFLKYETKNSVSLAAFSSGLVTIADPGKFSGFSISNDNCTTSYTPPYNRQEAGGRLPPVGYVFDVP